MMAIDFCLLLRSSLDGRYIWRTHSRKEVTEERSLSLITLLRDSFHRQSEKVVESNSDYNPSLFVVAGCCMQRWSVMLEMLMGLKLLQWSTDDFKANKQFACKSNLNSI